VYAPEDEDWDDEDDEIDEGWMPSRICLG